MEKASISFVKGKGSMNHNNRVFLTPNVDPTRTHLNITYCKETLEDAYEKCFGKAIEEYNAKQKRSDRRINGVEGYMNQIRNSKNGEKLFYENVVQVGNMYDSHVGTAEGDRCVQILDEYMRDFQRRNPNLYVFNAVLHNDEKTPHLHIDYIPIAHGYQKGLSVRNSLDRAFKEQGIDGKTNKFENSTKAWQNREKDVVADHMAAHGLERAEESGLKRKHQDLEEYKTVVQTVENAVKKLPQKIEYKEPMFGSKDVVQVKKADLLSLEKRAKLSEVHKNKSKSMMEEISKTQDTIRERDSAHEERVRMLSRSAEGLLKEANSEKEKYTALYQEQTSLNERYDALLRDYREKQREIHDLTRENNYLKAENGSLRGQIEELRQSIDERVQKAVEPLKKKINGLTERLEHLGRTFTNAVKAYNMIAYDEKHGYKAKLTEKQKNLFSGVERYVKKALRYDVGESPYTDDLIKEIDGQIDISEGIAKSIKEIAPQKGGIER